MSTVNLPQVILLTRNDPPKSRWREKKEVRQQFDQYIREHYGEPRELTVPLLGRGQNPPAIMEEYIQKLNPPKDGPVVFKPARNQRLVILGQTLQLEMLLQMIRKPDKKCLKDWIPAKVQQEIALEPPAKPEPETATEQPEELTVAEGPVEETASQTVEEPEAEQTVESEPSLQEAQAKSEQPEAER